MVWVRSKTVPRRLVADLRGTDCTVASLLLVARPCLVEAATLGAIAVHVVEYPQELVPGGNPIHLLQCLVELLPTHSNSLRRSKPLGINGGGRTLPRCLPTCTNVPWNQT